jgi:Na+-translocating ferredoxin:NAD+ oxidoreductase RnfD subunit
MIRRPADPRTAALRRFAASITAFTVLGAFVLGFEDPWAQPLIALAVAYSMELGLETIDAWATGRPARYRGGAVALVDFLLPAHITALSIALLLYPGQRLIAIVFAVAVATASKFVFRVAVNGRKRHFFNPSNFGIAVTLLAFPWVGISAPYQFTEGVSGALDWVVPVAIAVAGTILNATLTGKWPLILGWLGGFVAQGLLRGALLGAPIVAPLLPLTGAVFVLYTNYMITDPGTTPIRRDTQVAFGVATATVYGLLVVVHVAFGLFFALTIVSGVRGLGLLALDKRSALAGVRRLRLPRPATAARS